MVGALSTAENIRERVLGFRQPQSRRGLKGEVIRIKIDTERGMVLVQEILAVIELRFSKIKSATREMVRFYKRERCNTCDRDTSLNMKI